MKGRGLITLSPTWHSARRRARPTQEGSAWEKGRIGWSDELVVTKGRNHCRDLEERWGNLRFESRWAGQKLSQWREEGPWVKEWINSPEMWTLEASGQTEHHSTIHLIFSLRKAWRDRGSNLKDWTSLSNLRDSLHVWNSQVLNLRVAFFFLQFCRCGSREKTPVFFQIRKRFYIFSAFHTLKLDAVTLTSPLKNCV